MFGGEGESRQAQANESEKQRRERNTYFVPLERLTKEAELFARIQALRYSFAAYFGQDALKPFQAIRMAQVELSSTVGMLLQITGDTGSTAGHGGNDSGVDLRLALWGGRDRPDKFDKAIEEAIEQIELLCKPVLAKAVT